MLLCMFNHRLLYHCVCGITYYYNSSSGSGSGSGSNSSVSTTYVPSKLTVIAS